MTITTLWLCVVGAKIAADRDRVVVPPPPPSYWASAVIAEKRRAHMHTLCQSTILIELISWISESANH
uniref:Putative secreted protein n=1 Tax=Anopheles marajoara TaxID=58244 RepID=A0A2M4CFF5_9DIPT